MEELIVGVFLVFFTLEFVVESGLNELNLRYVRAHRGERNIPDVFQEKMSTEEYDKSVQYSLAKGRFRRWAEIYGRLIALVILFSGVLPFVDRLASHLAMSLFPVTNAHGIIFCFSFALIFSIASLPTDIYGTFGPEARFGFNKTTWQLYLTDKLKGLLLSILIGVPFLFVVLWLIEAMGSTWWVWAFIFIFTFQFLIVFLYPTFIAPLFNKFEPLQPGELRNRIKQLAEQVGFKTSGIYSMDGSKRSAHSNAYFTGIGRAKRIVLFDTLIAQMTIDQGIAVIAHEMGHYKMKHIRRMLLLQGVVLFAGLYLLSLALEYRPLFAAFGFDNSSSHAALVLFTLLSEPLTFYLGPLLNSLSRKHEYQADRFAVKTLRNGEPMEQALINLTVKNLTNLTPHPWYSAYHYSHPTPIERIGAIRAISI